MKDIELDCPSGLPTTVSLMTPKEIPPCFVITIMNSRASYFNSLQQAQSKHKNAEREASLIFGPKMGENGSA